MHCMFYLDNDCSIRVYQSFVIIFQNYFLLCLMLSVTYYAQNNYAGIISWSLPTGRDRPIMLIFYLLCYAALLIKFTYYAQNYAQE